MNKAEIRKLDLVEAYLDNGMTDTAARALSAMIRSTLSDKTAQELICMAKGWELDQLKEFII